MLFEELNLKEELLAAVADLGFETAMPVQEKVIPLLLQKNTDILALAQTGTGKTAAFGLPILEKIDGKNRKVEALVLSPTRELCLQIAGDIEKMAAHLKGVRVGAVYGGASIERQMLEIERGLKVVVATPGRMLDILKRGKIDFSGIKIVVFDEADEMLQMGFREELDSILQFTPEEKQTWLFSATMPKEIRSLANKYMKEPEEVVIGRRNEGSANVTHHYYLVQAKERYLALKRIIDYYPDIYSIIFCRTRRETQEVAENLIKDGYNADALHGDLSQAQRDNTMSRFRLKNLQLLVATDVAARGLDVNNLTHVLNYNLPDDVEQYTHRSGRTGRASATGISIALISPREKGRIKEIEKIINKSFELKALPTGEEICGKQVLYQAKRMLRANIEAEELQAYLPAVYDKLHFLSKEELIQRFVALEFNRFLNYYRNAPQVKDMSLEKKEERKRGRGANSTEEGLQRIFINLGYVDGVKPQNIIGLINDYLKDKSMKIGRIELCKTFSFVDIDSAYVERVFRALQGVVYMDRKVVVDLADGSGRGSKRSGAGRGERGSAGHEEGAGGGKRRGRGVSSRAAGADDERGRSGGGRAGRRGRGAERNGGEGRRAGGTEERGGRRGESSEGRSGERSGRRGRGAERNGGEGRSGERGDSGGDRSGRGSRSGGRGERGERAGRGSKIKAFEIFETKPTRAERRAAKKKKNEDFDVDTWFEQSSRNEKKRKKR